MEATTAESAGPSVPLKPLMTAKAVSAFIDREFPQLHAGGRCLHVLSVGPGEARMRLDPADRHLRPGGTISGPALFALADVAAYVAILAHIGPVALAVTTSSPSISCAGRRPEAWSGTAASSSSVRGWRWSRSR